MRKVRGIYNILQKVKVGQNMIGEEVRRSLFLVSTFDAPIYNLTSANLAGII